MHYITNHNIFNSPHFIFVKSAFEDQLKILKLLELDKWNFSRHLESDDHKFHLHFYTTWQGGWFHIIDDWHYTLWFDENLKSKLLQLSTYFDIFTYSIGDIDDSFDFYYFQKGKIIREYVVKDPNLNGGRVTINRGIPIMEESKALLIKDNEEKVIALATAIGIQIHHSMDKIQCYWRKELEEEKFQFDENEY